METTYTHDANGNVAQTQTRKGLLQTAVSTGYSADGNYPLTQTDARGQTVTKAVDLNLGTVQSVTDPKGQTVSYTYDVLKRVTKTETTAGGKVYRNEYVYDGSDRLAQVRHNTGGDPDDRGEGRHADAFRNGLQHGRHDGQRNLRKQRSGAVRVRHGQAAHGRQF